MRLYEKCMELFPQAPNMDPNMVKFISGVRARPAAFSIFNKIAIPFKSPSQDTHLRPRRIEYWK